MYHSSGAGNVSLVMTRYAGGVARFGVPGASAYCNTYYGTTPTSGHPLHSFDANVPVTAAAAIPAKEARDQDDWKRYHHFADRMHDGQRRDEGTTPALLRDDDHDVGRNQRRPGAPAPNRVPQPHSNSNSTPAGGTGTCHEKIAGGVFAHDERREQPPVCVIVREHDVLCGRGKASFNHGA